MCGIAAYVGPLPAESVLLVALERLKYRGYDSAGLAIQSGDEISVRKSQGRLRALAELIELEPLPGTCGIGHTRWATHGPPTTVNAHPHTDGDDQVAVVVNGIVENHEALRRELVASGAIFTSQTDSEVIPHLLAQYYEGDPVAAVRATVGRLEGSFALVAIFADCPGRIVAARQGAPLLAGHGNEHRLLASDVPALLPHASHVAVIGDGVVVTVDEEGICACAADGAPVELDFRPIEIDIAAVSMGDHDSFMAKEIAEQPQVLQRLIDSRLHLGELVEPDLGLNLREVNHIVFLACGTSWHAALLGKRFLEQLARVHVEVDISSEYRYRNPVASGGTLAMPISQSGETADTLASLRLAKSKFIPAVSLVNVVDSTIARESDGILPLMAGPEIGVASTKAYTCQVLALFLFALQVARAKGRLDRATLDHHLAAVAALPELVAATLERGEEAVLAACALFAPASATVFLGRSGEFPTALEGALKLKEIAYVHATGYAAGEFKHGPIALVTRALPVVCLCPRDRMYDKMVSNLEEVRARSGRIIAVGDAADEILRDVSDHLFPVDTAPEELLQPLLTVLPLQRYAYHVARQRGCDVDQPRNLAKSVTVE